MDFMWGSEAWSSPVGLAFFFVGAGLFLYFLSLSNKNNRRDK
jgi:hypothetical protein